MRAVIKLKPKLGRHKKELLGSVFQGVATPAFPRLDYYSSKSHYSVAAPIRLILSVFLFPQQWDAPEEFSLKDGMGS
jgi:hypothetical protein